MSRIPEDSSQFLPPEDQEKQLAINKMVLAQMIATDFQQQGIGDSSKDLGSILSPHEIQRRVVETLSQRDSQDWETLVRRRNKNRIHQVERDRRKTSHPHVA